MNLDGKALKEHSTNTDSAIACRINKSGEALIYVNEFADYDEVLKSLIQFVVERQKMQEQE